MVSNFHRKMHSDTSHINIKLCIFYNSDSDTILCQSPPERIYTGLCCIWSLFFSILGQLLTACSFICIKDVLSTYSDYRTMV